MAHCCIAPPIVPPSSSGGPPPLGDHFYSDLSVVSQKRDHCIYTRVLPRKILDTAGGSGLGEVCDHINHFG